MVRGGPNSGRGTVLADEIGDHACNSEHEPQFNGFPSGQSDSKKPAGYDLERKAYTHKNEHRLHQELDCSFDEFCNIHVTSLGSPFTGLPAMEDDTQRQGLQGRKRKSWKTKRKSEQDY